MEHERELAIIDQIIKQPRIVGNGLSRGSINGFGDSGYQRNGIFQIKHEVDGKPAKTGIFAYEGLEEES